MKSIINRFKDLWQEFIFDFINDYEGEPILGLFFQPAYIMLLIAQIFIFWEYFRTSALIVTIYIITHLILLYTIGKKKVDYEADKKEILYQRLFWISSSLLIICIFLLNWKLALITIALQIGTIVTVLILNFVIEIIVYTDFYMDKVEGFISPLIIFIFFLSVPIAAVSVSLFLLSISIIIKIIICLFIIIITTYVAYLQHFGISFIRIAIKRDYTKNIENLKNME